MAWKTQTGRWGRVAAAFVVGGGLIVSAGMARAAPRGAPPSPKPVISQEVAYDTTPALREMAKHTANLKKPRELPPERGRGVADKGHAGDAALQAAQPAAAARIADPVVTFEGLSNQDNFDLYGGRVNPPDPVGDVGPNHYVEMINLAFAVYTKSGERLLGPAPIGALWQGFAIDDCTDASGDPVVLYDQLADRWILTQFTTRGLDDPTLPFYNCVAISQTGDPTGAYYRYAFTSGFYFPDYPKYGVWDNSYLLTTREFGPIDEYRIGVYALERNKMINGERNVRTVALYLDLADGVDLNLLGDGLLPADIDGTRRPIGQSPAPIVGTQDDGGGYGATFDALNVFELSVKWNNTPDASLRLAAQIPVAAFDSIFPCGPTARDCIPQPGITNPAQFLDILSYRQRPTFRLAYRNFGSYEALVTSQSVEARPGLAGMRWYEIRRSGGAYSLFQQGTYAPDDGVHRWMGSAAMDRNGNMSLGYSVSNATNVYPGIRYTGRLSSDPLGQMTLGEGVIVNGSGVQRTTNSRWGDYSAMNVDPTDDCTFWYVNEYYTLAGEQSSAAGWQTRIGSFRLPGCS